VVILSLLKTQAVVLKSINLGESDKIITIFTDKLGKVDVVAHGARKPKNKFMASTQMFCYGEYVIYRGKNLYTLNESQIIESFQKIIMDLDKLSYASYFAELIDILNEKESRNTSMLALLLKTLYILLHDEVYLPLLKVVVDFKAISLAGYLPQVFSCVKCKSKDNLIYFSIKDGGVVCSKCNLDDSLYKIDTEALYFLQILKNIKLENLRDIKYNERTLCYIQNTILQYIKFYTNKEFKSINLLKKLNY
jgi:DNA repair protein RecO (recombination protein O)